MKLKKVKTESSTRSWKIFDCLIENFPIPIRTFQLKWKLSNLGLSNFSFFPTALSNYMYPNRTTYPCIVVWCTAKDLNAAKYAYTQSDIATWKFSLKHFLRGFRIWAWFVQIRSFYRSNRRQTGFSRSKMAPKIPVAVFFKIIK